MEAEMQGVSAGKQPDDRRSGSGEGWTDGPYTAATRDALVRKTGEQQRRVAAVPASGLAGQVDRGQHQKLLLGARGRLRIFGDLPAALKAGPFAVERTCAVACRFSNGQPCPFSDREADVRGVALKFFLPSGEEVDLLATNEGGRSHATEPRSFMAFADVLVAKIEGGAAGAGRELMKRLRGGELTLAEVARIGLILLKEVKLRKVRSLATESYWGSVVGLGTVALKYSLHPHGAAPVSAGFRADAPDYLRAELLGRLATGPVRWRLAAQLFVNEDSTPVNDAARAWAGPIVPVGELEIDAVPSVADESTIDRMAFNPANGFDPLGITHARKDVYAASAGNRRGRGLVTAEDARQFLAAAPGLVAASPSSAQTESRAP